MQKPTLVLAAGLCVLAATAAACSRPQPAATPQSATPQSAAPASAPAEQQPKLTAGEVVTASATELTIKAQDGPVTFQLSPATVIMVPHAGTLADIKPGSFLGTTNVPSADGTGESTEVHIFPPGVKMGEGDRPMGPAPTPAAEPSRMTNGTVSAAAPSEPQSRMTNGAVGAVGAAASGVKMEVAYAGGRRQIVVPPGTPIQVMSAGSPALLKPGAKVLVGALPGPDGTSAATFINVQP